MNTNHRAPNWHTLGVLELPVGVSTNEALHAWLAEILAFLNLSPDFLERVLRSAQESVGHAFHPNAEDALSYTHISILVPPENTPPGKSWGFFHIERIEPDTDGSNKRHHVIDFYLYVEGG